MTLCKDDGACGCLSSQCSLVMRSWKRPSLRLQEKRKITIGCVDTESKAFCSVFYCDSFLYEGRIKSYVVHKTAGATMSFEDSLCP